MKKSILLLFISLSFTWISCNNNQTTNPAKEESAAPAPEQEAEKHDHHNDDATAAIELNNGERWAVNNEMKPYVTAGTELVDNFIKTGNSDYAALAKQLKEQNDKLIKSCTMEGKSHDELHKWLHPHLELVKELEEEKDAAKNKEVVTHLKDSYEMYNKYFQ